MIEKKKCIFAVPNTKKNMTDLKRNYQYFLDNKKVLAKTYAGMYVVIVDCNVVGSYADENTAYEESEEKYGLGNFIVQLCSEDEDAYTQTYHSRVAFAY